MTPRAARLGAAAGRAGAMGAVWVAAVATRAGTIAAVAAVSGMLPAAAAAGTLVIVGARVHPISAPAFDDGVVIVEGERIAAVGVSGEVELPDDAAVIDAAGLELWPAMIDARTYLGLVEIGEVRATRDHSETGRLNPSVRAEVAINPDSELFPVTRANGILLAATLPRSGLICGTAAAIALDGWTWEDMVRRASIGLVMGWPDMHARRPGAKPHAGQEGARADTISWRDHVAAVTNMLEEARAYASAGAAGGDLRREADVAWESLARVVAGEVPVWVAVASEAQARAAVDWADEQGLRMVLLDDGDAWRCADELAARDIPVVVRTNRLPRHEHDAYDTPFAAPARLHAAGVRVCFGSGDAANSRVLPQEAARAMAWGLPRDAAERALTLTAAEVLGIDDRYGSLEVGKSATFILVEGDLLETRMQVRRAWLDGREVGLENRHTRLWHRYSERPRRSTPPSQETASSPR
jgi:imidazolonepropionase-like amidohydrolase